ncbi:MAG: acetate--CoA ligase family protein [Deltaproteobacteria bacterium]|nr:acetate--CoA ligase family protein [Deltaproteobacteria bacterium]
MSTKTELDPVFNPKSIAVIGASRKPGTIGNKVVENLIEGGYKGKIYPVNPGADEILGLKAYGTINDVPGDVDVAVFCVPAKFVLDSARQCAQKRVKGMVVISSGFSETGNRKDEEELVAIAKAVGSRVIGPNIVGILSNSTKANASFAPCLPYPGKTAFITQSGALLIALDMATFVRKMGFSAMISNGNMADVDFADAIEYYDEDPDTSCITLYIEGLKDGRRFIQAGRKASKPIVAIKSGVSARGAAAAASHTGSLAGATKIYEAAFRQAHVVPAHTIDELLNRSQAMSMQPPLTGDNILVVTNGGGIGVLATDSAERYNVPLSAAPSDLQDALRKCMPDFGSAKNPVDITGGAGLEGYKGAIAAALKHPWVNGLVVLYCETAVTSPPDIAKGVIEAIKATNVTDKPIVAAFVGGERCDQARSVLSDAGIPMFDDPDKAMSVMSGLRQYARFLDEGREDDFKPHKDVDTKAAREVVAEVRKAGRTSFTEPEAKRLFAAYGLPVGRCFVAKTEDEAVRLAGEIGFPLVMKIVSPQILHKSDACCVKININSVEEVRENFKTIMANAKKFKPDADLHGVLMQEMAPKGTEVICGSINDPQFGPTIMFGLGGIFVEVLKDVTFRVTPISPHQAMEMLPGIKAFPILQGVRGEKRRDQEALADVISRLSQLVYDLGDEIAESDANPILLYEQGKGLKVVDARVILKKK